MEELRQTKDYAEYIKLLGWQVDIIDEVYIYSKKLPLVGYYTKIQRPVKPLSESIIKEIIKVRHPFIIDIEPLNEKQEQLLVNDSGFKKTKESSLPSKTVRIDLTKSERQLLSGMHYKTRYNIKMASKKRLTIIQSENVELFSNLWHSCAQKRGLYLSLKKEILSIYKAFGKKAKIFLAKDEGSTVGGILLLLTERGSYYMYAAATKEGKEKFAPTLLAWETIKFSKSIKKKYYDFEGIYDERYPIKSWKGFSRFKQSFGGEVVEFPGVIRRLIFPFNISMFRSI